MEYRNYEILDVVATDNVINTPVGKFPIHGNAIHGTIDFGEDTIEVSGGLLFDGYDLFIPTSTGFTRHRLNHKEYQMYTISSSMIMHWLQVFGKVKKISIDNHEIIVIFDDTSKLEGWTTHYSFQMNFESKFRGGIIKIVFDENKFLEVSPFGKSPMPETVLYSTTNGYVPAFTLKVFDEYKFIPLAEGIKYLRENNGMWLGTEEPIIMKEASNSKLIVKKIRRMV